MILLTCAAFLCMGVSCLPLFSLGEENSHVLSIKAPDGISLLFNEVHPVQEGGGTNQSEFSYLVFAFVWF